jgi:hypothetical protein
MKKGSKMSLEQRQRVSEGLKGVIPWNKGKRFVEVRRDASFLRKDKNYYLNELKNNAIRGKKKSYFNNPERRKQIDKLTKERQEITGVHRPMKYWSTEEISYLRNNYKTKTILEMALELERSWSSVEHKLNRMQLTKYNSWTK